LDQCLIDLEGQRLLSVESGSVTHSWVFNFDLGGVLEIGPSAEIPDTQWSLHRWSDGISSCENDGALTFEKTEPKMRDGKN
jgi:hypothetical protein